MAKTVQLSDEAYRKLKMLKKEGESFSDVVNRVVGSLKDPRRLLDLSPPRQGLDWERLDRQMRTADREKGLRLFAREDRE